MVAPVIIAGLGALGGIAFGAIAQALGKRKVIYAVTWIGKGPAVQGKVFNSLEEAMKAQDQMAASGIASIIIEKERGQYRGLRTVRALAAGGLRVSPDALRRMKREDLDLGAYGDGFSTHEEQQRMTNLTTRFPTPEWARRAKEGPYPETDPGRDEVLPPIEPLFRETTSSHEWKTEVIPFSIPGKFFHGRRGPVQPDELVVDKALQYPEGPRYEKKRAAEEGLVREAAPAKVEERRKAAEEAENKLIDEAFTEETK